MFRMSKKNKIRQLMTGFGLATVICAASLAHAAPPTIINVTTTDDVLDGSDGFCSLREAVINVNNATNTFADCTTPSTTAKNIIVLSEPEYDLDLKSSLYSDDDDGYVMDLDLKKDVTIIGSGTRFNKPKDIFTFYRIIDVFEGVNVTLEGLVISKGEPSDNGAGIQVRSTASSKSKLLLKNCQVGGNKASGNGGGIYGGEEATIILNRTTIYDNEASETSGTASGAGIYLASGSLTMLNSTVSGNKLSITSGNLQGAGIATQSGTVKIINSTVSSNVSDGNVAVSNGGGIWLGSAATLNISNSTIGYNIVDSSNDDTNGGGIYITAGAQVNMINTIVSDNLCLATKGVNGGPDIYGEVNSYGYNMVKDQDLHLTWNLKTSNDDYLDTDPVISLLTNNGGPTQTHALDGTSPAINMGSCFDLDGNSITTDQRNEPRSGVSCDIGSYEYQEQE